MEQLVHHLGTPGLERGAAVASDCIYLVQEKDRGRIHLCDMEDLVELFLSTPDPRVQQLVEAEGVERGINLTVERFAEQ